MRRRALIRRRDGATCVGVSKQVSREKRGQATVEFAVVTAGFLAATVALGAMWHVIVDGVLVDHAVAVASHHLQVAAPTTITDIFLY